MQLYYCWQVPTAAALWPTVRTAVTPSARAAALPTAATLGSPTTLPAGGYRIVASEAK